MVCFFYWICYYLKMNWNILSRFLLLCLKNLMMGRIYCYCYYSKSHADEGAHTPFVLIDNHDVIIKYGIVHGEGDACEIAR